MSDSIEFTAEKLERLREAFEKAIKEEKDIFEFEGNQIYVSYAKYLIQYLKQKLGVR